MHKPRQFTPAHTGTRRIGVLIIVLVIAAALFVPVVRGGLRIGLGVVGTSIARAANSIGGFFGSIGTSVRTKRSLQKENTTLKNQIVEMATRLSAHETLARENADLKAAFGRMDSSRFTLAAVIAKPPHSVYDTMIIDGGAAAGFEVGKVVYAVGTTPIGTIAEVFAHSALVRLYSSPGVETELRLAPSNIDVTVTGRGGGNFLVTVPHDFDITEATVVSKELTPAVIALYKKTLSDPRDPLQSLLFAAPVNVGNLAFVEVRQ